MLCMVRAGMPGEGPARLASFANMRAKRSIRGSATGCRTRRRLGIASARNFLHRARRRPLQRTFFEPSLSRIDGTAGPADRMRNRFPSGETTRFRAETLPDRPDAESARASSAPSRQQCIGFSCRFRDSVLISRRNRKPILRAESNLATAMRALHLEEARPRLPPRRVGAGARSSPSRRTRVMG